MQHFDNCSHLEVLLEEGDLAAIHRAMVAEVAARVARQLGAWREVIASLPPNQRWIEHSRGLGGI